MTILARIRAHGGTVTAHRFQLRLKPGRLSAEALEWIKRHRHRLHVEVWPLADEWAERAAIREFDGYQDRAEAEEEAYWEVLAR